MNRVISLRFCTHPSSRLSFFFFFNDTATTEIYTLSLHDALPISRGRRRPLSRSSRKGAGIEFGRKEPRSEEHTSELQSQSNLVCRLLLEKKKKHRLRGCRVPHLTLGRCDVLLQPALSDTRHVRNT